MNITNILTSSLLKADVRKRLSQNHLIRYGVADDDLLWQHLSLDYFYGLLNEHGLYLKKYTEYDEYDEELAEQFFILNELKAEEREEYLKIYKEFQNEQFISCWYNRSNLSDVVFKVYTGQKSEIIEYSESDGWIYKGGIAIGTTYENLRDTIKKGDDKEVSNIVCGNIQYISDVCRSSQENISEYAQVYAPIFTKRYHFSMDNEFRLCFENKIRKDENNFRFSVDVKNLIQYIAISRKWDADTTYMPDMNKIKENKFLASFLNAKGDNYDILKDYVYCDQLSTSGFYVFSKDVTK